jgi:REP element-mobilizing transposase RayT
LANVNQPNPNKFHRRSLRLPAYDYSLPGRYFVTICTQNRECLFGEIKDGEMVLNEIGKMVESVWKNIPQRFSFVELDQFVVMPNHFPRNIDIQ